MENPHSTSAAWRKRDLWWPLGGTVLELVVAIAIQQYPEFFNDNKLMLPTGIVAVLFCWLFPLLFDGKKFYQRLLHSRLGTKHPRISTIVFLVIAFAFCGIAVTLGIKLFRAHSEHIGARLRAVTHIPEPASTGLAANKGGANSSASKSGQPVANNDLGADLHFIFYGHDTLRFTLLNTSKRASGRNPWVFFGLIDVTNPYPYRFTAEQDVRIESPLPVPSNIIRTEYVRPGETAGRHDVFENTKLPAPVDFLPTAREHIKDGDKVWGFGQLTCENCSKTRYYYIYWVMGQGGWYAEVPKENALKLPSISPPRSLPDAELDEIINGAVPGGAIKKPILAPRPGLPGGADIMSKQARDDP